MFIKHQQVFHFLANTNKLDWYLKSVSYTHLDVYKRQEELLPLTDNLNALLREGRTHIERYRNALADLAHSLKTPLAVLRSTLENNASADEIRQSLVEQLERMNRTVDYQLQRAAASGQIALTAPLPVTAIARKIQAVSYTHLDVYKRQA